MAATRALALDLGRPSDLKCAELLDGPLDSIHDS